MVLVNNTRGSRVEHYLYNTTQFCRAKTRVLGSVRFPWRSLPIDPDRRMALRCCLPPELRAPRPAASRPPAGPPRGPAGGEDDVRGVALLHRTPASRRVWD